MKKREVSKFLLLPFAEDRCSGMAFIFIAVVLAATTATAYMILQQSLVRNLQASHYDIWRESFQQLRTFFVENVDCEPGSVNDPASCTNGSRFRIEYSLRPGNETMISDLDPPTVIGELEWQAVCISDSAYEVQVRPADEVNHPLRKETWVDWHKLVEVSAPIHCD